MDTTRPWQGYACRYDPTTANERSAVAPNRSPVARPCPPVRRLHGRCRVPEPARGRRPGRGRPSQPPAAGARQRSHPAGVVCAPWLQIAVQQYRHGFECVVPQPNTARQLPPFICNIQARPPAVTEALLLPPELRPVPLRLLPLRLRRRLATASPAPIVQGRRPAVRHYRTRLGAVLPPPTAAHGRCRRRL